MIESDSKVHIVGGDYNCVLNPTIDRRYSGLINGTVRPDEGEYELSSQYNTLQLEDVWRRRHPHLEDYTFSRNNSMSRIDYFLCYRQ